MSASKIANILVRAVSNGGSLEEVIKTKKSKININIFYYFLIKLISEKFQYLAFGIKIDA